MNSIWRCRRGWVTSSGWQTKSRDSKPNWQPGHGASTGVFLTCSATCPAFWKSWRDLESWYTAIWHHCLLRLSAISYLQRTQGMAKDECVIHFKMMMVETGSHQNKTTSWLSSGMMEEWKHSLIQHHCHPSGSKHRENTRRLARSLWRHYSRSQRHICARPVFLPWLNVKNTLQVSLSPITPRYDRPRGLTDTDFSKLMTLIFVKWSYLMFRFIVSWFRNMFWMHIVNGTTEQLTSLLCSWRGTVSIYTLWSCTNCSVLVGLVTGQVFSRVVWSKIWHNL